MVTRGFKLDDEEHRQNEARQAEVMMSNLEAGKLLNVWDGVLKVLVGCIKLQIYMAMPKPKEIIGLMAKPTLFQK